LIGAVFTDCAFFVNNVLDVAVAGNPAVSPPSSEARHGPAGAMEPGGEYIRTPAIVPDALAGLASERWQGIQSGVWSRFNPAGQRGGGSL